MRKIPGPALLALLFLFPIGSLSSENQCKPKLEKLSVSQAHRRANLTESLARLTNEVTARIQRGQMRNGAAAASPGASYINILPFVTRENNSRTNVGLNNYSENSFVNGSNPNANILIGLYDQQGNIAGAGIYVVKTHALNQINDIITSLNGSIGTGWLMMFSDEPFTAWASIISNSTNDPSIEMAIPIQLGKPSPFVDGLAVGYEGTRLMIPSSVKTGTFSSSLVVLNIGMSAGDFTVELHSNTGEIVGSNSTSISANGLYVNNDIRSSVNGTFGEIVIVPTSDSLMLMASSIVKSSSGNGAFFPAFTLPPSERMSVAGMWQGSLTGGSTNAQVTVTLFQERSMLYGLLEITSGSFPATSKQFVINGGILASGLASMTIDDVVDTDSANSWISFRIIGALNSSGNGLEGVTLYSDEQNRHNYGSFTLSRTGDIFQ